MNTIDRIFDLMKKNSVTAAQLSKELGLSKSTFTQWKQGLQNPSFDIVSKIADYFNVSIDYIAGRTDNPTPPKKELTADDELNLAISKLTPKGRERTKEYIDLLKTREEFTQEVAEALEPKQIKPLPD